MRVRDFGIALLIAACVLTLGRFWWWALLGMTHEIGMALGVTVLVFGFGGAFVAMEAS